MEMFEITVELQTPVLISNGTFWTLDAVCFGILSEMKDVGLIDVDPVSMIPITSKDGLFFASKAIFNDEVELSRTKIAGIRPVKDMKDATSKLTSSRSRLPKIDTNRGPLKGHLSKYREIAARSVSWIAEGNPDAVAALITNARQIGARRNEGYGVVGEITIERNPDLNPLIQSGKLMRPIPQGHDCAKGISNSAAMMQHAWMPPYYSLDNRAICFVPTD